MADRGKKEKMKIQKFDEIKTSFQVFEGLSFGEK